MTCLGHAITKCGGSPIGFAGFESGLWGISFGWFWGPPIGCEGSLSRFKISRQLPTMHKFWSATRIMLESSFTKYG